MCVEGEGRSQSCYDCGEFSENSDDVVRRFWAALGLGGGRWRQLELPKAKALRAWLLGE